MAISDKLNYLIETKQLFKDRLNSLGAEITSSTTFRNYLTWLDTFYGEVSDKTDISQNGVVGRTSQETTTGKNLIPFTNQDFTLKGIRFYVQRGSLYLNGTSSGEIGTTSQEFKDNFSFTLSAGTYVFSLSNQIGATSLRKYDDNTSLAIINGDTIKSSTFTLNEDTKVYIGIYVYQQTFNDLKSTYLVETGSTATSYEQYTGKQPSPNPNYPQPINNLSGDVAYKVSGKNLFNENYYSDKTKYEKYGNYYAFAELPNYFKTKFYANVFLKGISNNLTICFNDSKSIPSNDKKVLNGGVINSNVEFDFTNAEKVYIGIGNGSGIDLDTDIDNIFNNYNIMCTLSLNVPYEPYIEPQTFNIPLGDIELCKIDTYEDKIYSSNGRFYLEKKNDKITLNGSEYWREAGTQYSGLFSSYISIPNMKKQYLYSGDLYSNYFTEKAFNVQEEAITKSSDPLVYDLVIFRIASDKVANLNEWKNWLSTHNTLVYYRLSTPTTTEITQENYPALYNALKQIQDYLTAYKINKEFILGYSSPEIEY